MLELSNVHAGYGETTILSAIDLEMGETEVVSVIGPNGAGKTTLLRTISGNIEPSEGEILFNEERIDGEEPYRIADRGICHVPQEQALFTNMTVRENLLVGSYLPDAQAERSDSFDLVYDLFPRLAERQEQLAGTLSGGERRMLAIGKGLMSDPDLLLLDEPSSGLAPNLVDEVFDGITTVREQTGMPILLVEQRAGKSLDFADYVHILENGSIQVHGPSDEIRQQQDIRERYLSM